MNAVDRILLPPVQPGLTVSGPRCGQHPAYDLYCAWCRSGHDDAEHQQCVPGHLTKNPGLTISKKIRCGAGQCHQWPGYIGAASRSSCWHR